MERWQFISTGSVKKLLDFSPLATVLESPDSLPQTATEITIHTLTGVPVSTEPKPKHSSPTSANDVRAKNGQHKYSIMKPVKPATTSENQRNSLSHAIKASPACGGNKTTGDEEEQFPDMGLIDRARREIRGSRSTNTEAEIRWPSRSLDRMNQNKRKRFDEPVAIPSPDRGSYGLVKNDLRENIEEYGVTKEQPGKIRRTSGSREFTSQVAGCLNTVDNTKT